jgi:signal transduction histidine kinase
VVGRRRRSARGQTELRLCGVPLSNMTDQEEGTKNEVADVKFLIYDLRVERFINEIIHFHVTLNTDLEIYSVEQAQILHGHDLQKLKETAVAMRKALREYSTAVKNFSPDHTILRAGRNYIETVRSMCMLVLNPLWGRVDNVLVFLPHDSRSVRSYEHYQNCIHWIRGVFRRIEYFLEETRTKGIHQEFDIAAELKEFTSDVVHGYVMEESGAKVEIELGQLDPARIGGIRQRFRRMYFNLVMNAVDAMAGRKRGVLSVNDTVEGDRVVLRVRDNGVGMSESKIEQLLTDRENLDGELHSLGFVFVRRTIADFKGDLSIESKVGTGTTVTVSFPVVRGEAGGPRTAEDSGTEGQPGPDTAAAAPQAMPAVAAEAAAAVPEAAAVGPSPTAEEKNSACGRLIYEAYQASEAQYPGCVFAISITKDGRVDYFTHRPQHRWWNMNHEELSPMCYQATVRGRLEDDDEKRPLLTLKEPQNVREYFEFKGMPEPERSGERFIGMVHDEYIRVARKLIETGLSPDTGVELSGVQRFFPGRDDLGAAKSIPLRLLAAEPLSSETSD